MTPENLTPQAPASRRWADVLAGIEAHMKRLGAPASRAVVLVPYAQLMEPARRTWAAVHPSGFAPRFESSRNWARSLQPFVPVATDLSGDMARDALVAAHLLDRVARGRLDPALSQVMVARLVDAARQLAPLAAARAPAERATWAEALRDSVAPGSATLQWESLLASLALAWAETSSYPTDVLWSPLAEPGSGFDALVVLQGFQPDPLTTALMARWGERATLIQLHDSAPAPASTAAQLHACGDAEDEAQRAAACVVAHANAGRRPVALVANDRLLTRRISALLHGAGVPVRDETGWKLSTTHAAAQLMSLLRAADHHSRMDDVLDWLKQVRSASQSQVSALERQARALGVSRGAAALAHPKLAPLLPAGLGTTLTGLQAPRPLAQWLADLGQALRACGWWDAFSADQAGQQIVQALRLGDGAAHELAALANGLQSEPDGAVTDTAARRSTVRMSLHAFSAWVRDALEAASFTARVAGEPAAVILPMPQLLGRSFGAVVAPGCDEVRLQPSPELAGQWTPAQREALGLPSREALAQAAQQAWQAMIATPAVDLLWRTQDQGEAVLPSPWIQGLQALASVPANDPRGARDVVHEPTARPMPSAGELLPEAISASAYQDLRDCPYRFFSLRQLRLQEADELEAEPDKRDMGIWLHAVLKAFHESRAGREPDVTADLALIDQLAERVAQEMGLNTEEVAEQPGSGRAGFLPFLAAWPALRDGYLHWLQGFEATAGRAGPRFDQAELSLSSQAGPYRLIGKLDRVDHQDSPEGAIPFVIDYKTEPRQTTTDRVKLPMEDTQIGFYAALLPDETLRAAYLSISESRHQKEPTQLVEQSEVLALREHLREGLVHDLDRVAAGHPMPALGEGRVCEFCAARGLCRKDFWVAA